MAEILDRDLMADLLQDGDRSALFVSQSRMVQKHYERHRIYFFYLHTSDEIARALVLDLCRQGYGYPVALREAHEGNLDWPGLRMAPAVAMTSQSTPWN